MAVTRQINLRLGSRVLFASMEQENELQNYFYNQSMYWTIVDHKSNTDHLIILVTFVCCCVSGIFALTGNFLILWLMVTTRAFRRNPTFIFIGNVCMSDVLIATLVVPFQFQVSLLRRWILPWFLCYVCPTVQVVLVSNSIFTLTATALERYRAVLYPLRARLTKGQAKLEIIFIWALSSVVALPTVLSLQVDLEFDPATGRDTLPHCHRSDLFTTRLYDQYSTALVVVQYFIPLCIISYAYIRMAYTLTRPEPNTQDLIHSSHLYTKQVQRKKRKVVQMLFCVVSLFLICWLPIQLVSLARVLCPTLDDLPYFNVIKFACNWLALSNSCYNPYIYILYNEKIRNEFRQRFGCMYYVFCSVPEKSQQKINPSAS